MSLKKLPRKGQRVRFHDGTTAKVTEVKDSGIVVVQYDNGDFTTFIGRFADGTFNKLATVV